MESAFQVDDVKQKFEKLVIEQKIICHILLLYCTSDIELGLISGLESTHANTIRPPNQNFPPKAVFSFPLILASKFKYLKEIP